MKKLSSIFLLAANIVDKWWSSWSNADEEISFHFIFDFDFDSDSKRNEKEEKNSIYSHYSRCCCCCCFRINYNNNNRIIFSFPRRFFCCNFFLLLLLAYYLAIANLIYKQTIFLFYLGQRLVCVCVSQIIVRKKIFH